MDLTEHLLHKHATAREPVVEITSQLRDIMLNHDWPGNVRELENVVRKLLVLRRCDMVAEDLRCRARTRNAAAARAAVQERVPAPAKMVKPRPMPEWEEVESAAAPIAMMEAPARWDR